MDEGREIPVVWVGLDDLPALMANLFICQSIAPDQFVLSVGQAVPPPLLGTPEEIQEQAAAIQFLPVKPLARLSLTEQTLESLAQVIQENLQRHRAARKAGTQ